MAWEVLVVENACTDETVSVVEAHASELPVRLTSEPKLGLSHARNAAVREARGEYIIWIDDDVLVNPGWLEAYCAVFAKDDGTAFFGGPIRAWFPNPPPRWLTEALPSVENAFSLIDYGPDTLWFDRGRLPFGANFAVRTDVQRDHAYSPQLGRRGRGMRSGEETAVLLSILAHGGRGVWVPGAVLGHYLSPERQRVGYLRRYYFYNGLAYAGAAAELFDSHEQGPHLFGRPRWLWREAVTNEVLYWLARPFASPAVWSQRLRRSTSAWGAIRGYGARGALD
jgi:glycosyltransferase involved in cell wall biosynthesis